MLIPEPRSGGEGGSGGEARKIAFPRRGSATAVEGPGMESSRGRKKASLIIINLMLKYKYRLESRRGERGVGSGGGLREKNFFYLTS